MQVNKLSLIVTVSNNLYVFNLILYRKFCCKIKASARSGHKKATANNWISGLNYIYCHPAVICSPVPVVGNLHQKPLVKINFSRNHFYVSKSFKEYEKI